LAKISSTYADELDVLYADMDVSDDEIDEMIDEYVSDWKGILIASGILCCITAILSLCLAINAFSLSKRYQYYHHSN
jgi:hypothetical protein